MDAARILLVQIIKVKKLRKGSRVRSHCETRIRILSAISIRVIENQIRPEVKKLDSCFPNKKKWIKFIPKDFLENCQANHEKSNFSIFWNLPGPFLKLGPGEICPLLPLLVGPDFNEKSGIRIRSDSSFLWVCHNI